MSAPTNDQIKRRVRKIFPAFVSDVDPDQLCDHLIGNQIITTECWNKIRTKGTQQERCRELLLHLDSIKNPRTFLVVRDALKTICPHIYEEIEHQTDTETGATVEISPERSDQLPQNNWSLQERVTKLEQERDEARAELNEYKERLQAAEAESQRRLKELNAVKGLLQPPKAQMQSGNLKTRRYESKVVTKNRVFTVDDINKLYEKATTYIKDNYSDGGSAYCRWFYRNRSPEYFDGIYDQKNGIMETHTKDNTGDPRSPINGQMKGLFFIANVKYGSITGEPLPKSPFGSRRLLVPAEDLLEKAPNLYFADFYCIRFSNNNHYVTIVMTVPESETDQFCANHLKKLDVSKNPFLSRDSSSILRVTMASKLYVEIFYTEDLDIKRYQPLEDTETIGQGTTPYGNPKDPCCLICNI